jgi:hypothetical protein
MDISIENFTIKIPVDYQQVNSLPGDPAGSMSFMKKTPEAACLVMYSGIPSEQSMPFNSKEEVVRGIHSALAEDQGLIEVESGITPAGKKYIYSIVKTVNRGTVGVQYSLVLHIGYFAEHVRLWPFTTMFVFSLLKACSEHHVAILCEGSTLMPTFAEALCVFYCEAAGIMRQQGSHVLRTVRKWVGWTVGWRN